MIESASLEVNVVESCNLRCRGCSHLSPILPRNAVDPAELAHDLGTLAGSYHAHLLRLLGGEPLLHPDLLAVVGAVRRSGICDTISIQTNGLLLDRTDDALWTAVDIIRITTYPGTELTEDRRLAHEDRARRNGTTFLVEDVDVFRVPYLERRHPHAQHVFDHCKMIHEWSCHTVAGGHFYRCPQTYFLGRVLGLDDAGEPLHEPGLTERLQRLLTSKDPLPACDHCLGSSGARLPHEQVARVDWRDHQRPEHLEETAVLVDLPSS